MMCVRFEKLDSDTLMQLSKSALMKGMEQVIIDAMCSKLRSFESNQRQMGVRDRNYLNP